MRSTPTMLHVRMPAGDSLLRGERVRVLHLIERVTLHGGHFLHEFDEFAIRH